MKKLHIQWIDSNMIHEQTNEKPDVAIIDSIGYVLSETDKCVVIARDIIGDEYRSTIAIPNISIITQTEI